MRVGSSVKLPDFESKHILKSLRLKKGDEIFLFNGEKEYKAKLKFVSKDAVMAEIIEEVRLVSDKNFKIDLIQGLSKAKSFEFILEKATEIGVNNIIPMETEYSVVKIEDKIEGKQERWERIVISSCKQAERINIPTISKAIKVENIEEVSKNYDFLLAFVTESDERIGINEILSQISGRDHAKVAVLIGTEGGFSPSEIH